MVEQELTVVGLDCCECSGYALGLHVCAVGEVLCRLCDSVCCLCIAVPFGSMAYLRISRIRRYVRPHVAWEAVTAQGGGGGLCKRRGFPRSRKNDP